MNIKYRQLKGFALVVETGSFAAAAERLAVTPSSFSALIRDLELDLGVLLFERTTRTCRPTESGRNFYDLVRGPLEDLEAGYGYLREMGRGARGTLRLACLPSLASSIAIPHLARFQQIFPEVRVKLRERKHEELLDAVRGGDVEFGIGILMRPDADLRFEYLSSDRLMFVVPSGHPLEAMQPVWKCLEQFPYIMVGHGNTERALALAEVRAPAAYEVEHVATALAMVRHGLGISVLPTSAFPGVDIAGLECIPIEGESALRRIGVITKTNRALNRAATAFIELLSESGEKGADNQEHEGHSPATSPAKPGRVKSEEAGTRASILTQKIALFEPGIHSAEAMTSDQTGAEKFR